VKYTKLIEQVLETFQLPSLKLPPLQELHKALSEGKSLDNLDPAEVLESARVFRTNIREITLRVGERRLLPFFEQKLYAMLDEVVKTAENDNKP